MKFIILIVVFILSFSTCFSQTDNLKAQQYYNMAMDKVFRKDHRAAIADFDQALRNDSNFMEAYENRGVAKYYLSDYSGALADYSKALELDPDDYNTCVRRGWARFMLKDYSGALADFSRAVDGDPDNPEYYNTRGEVKYRLQDYSGSIADFDKVINSWYSGRKAKSEAYFWRGLARVESGDKNGACADLQRSARMGNKKAGEIRNAVCD